MTGADKFCPRRDSKLRVTQN